ncbi:MAG: DNA repair protein RecO [Persephonella sp.]|nr:DNA repair protein RecO [Persephonella sp.]
MSSLIKDEAIVLRKSYVGDYDVSITVYMRKQGKENIYLPKGQLFKSPYISSTEPFTWFKGVFIRKREKFFIKEIDRSKTLGIEICKDLNRFQTASYMFDTFNRYIIYPDEKMFIFLKKSLYYLTDSCEIDIFRLNFLAKLIYLSGIYPELKRCVRCGEDINRNNYQLFSISEGGVVCRKCSRQKGNLSYRHLKYLQQLKFISFKNLKKLKIKGSLYLEKILSDYLSKNM